MTLGKQRAIVSNGTEDKRFETKADEAIDTKGAVVDLPKLEIINEYIASKEALQYDSKK